MKFLPKARGVSAGRGLTLRTKLGLGFIGVGLFVAALLLVGNHVIIDAAQRLESTLTAQVQPLVRLNRLQAQISRIRVLEVELPVLTDVYEISDQIELLATERGAFDRELKAFLKESPNAWREDATNLEEHWRRYQADLDAVSRYTLMRDLPAVQRISTYESSGRFRMISRLLKQAVDTTQRSAGTTFEKALIEQGRQRNIVIITSAIGLTLLALWIVLFARSVNERLSRLRRAAIQVAEGGGERPIQVSGHDELADLGAAFNAMQEKVAARERALRVAHDELEFRVAARTRELHQANALLLREIEERKKAEAMLHHQAEYDSLTNLPNRMLAMQKLSQAIAQADHDGKYVVLIFLDLDDFKKVNDTLGHPTGDALLVQAAKRLRGAVDENCVVARHGGDEFLVIIGDLVASEHANAMAERILHAFAPSFDIGDSELVVTPSLGLAIYPDDGDEPSKLLRHADLAMYEAKESGRNTYRYFSQKVHDRSVRRFLIERQLRNALQRDEFELVYQPVVSTKTRGLIGAEALLRWHSPDDGLIAPELFVPVAEHTGLIVEIGEWVLWTACEQLARWHEMGHDDLTVAVNVSPRQFRGDRLLKSISACLAAHKVPPRRLHIEVTEGLLIRNHPEVRETLTALSAMGVRLAMDDFGTGYSSLSYLKRFPFHSLKIDREFVRDVATDPDDRALVNAAIRLGKGLGLTVVAEGVESDEQLKFLAEHECDHAQGFLFGEPLPAAEFSAYWFGARSKNNVQEPVFNQSRVEAID